MQHVRRNVMSGRSFRGRRVDRDGRSGAGCDWGQGGTGQRPAQSLYGRDRLLQDAGRARNGARPARLKFLRMARSSGSPSAVACRQWTAQRQPRAEQLLECRHGRDVTTRSGAQVRSGIRQAPGQLWRRDDGLPARYSRRSGWQRLGDGRPGQPPAPPAGQPADAPLPPAPQKVVGHQVFKFSPEGKLLLTLGKPGGNQPGQPPDQASFYQPNDVITYPNGDILVAEGHGATARAPGQVRPLG